MVSVEAQEVNRALARDMVINFFAENKGFLKKQLRTALHDELSDDLHNISKKLYRERGLELHEFRSVAEAAEEVIFELLENFADLPVIKKEPSGIEDTYFAGLAPSDLFEYIDKLYERYDELGGDDDEITIDNIPALMRVIMILANIFEHELKDYDNAYELLMNGFDIDPGNRDILKRLVILSGKMSVGERLVDTLENTAELLEDAKIRSELFYAAGRVYLEVLGDPECARIVLHLSLESNAGNRRAANLLDLVSI